MEEEGIGVGGVSAGSSNAKCSQVCRGSRCLLALLQVIVQARKPDFFTYNMSLFEVVTEDGLMRPVMTGAHASTDCAIYAPFSWWIGACPVPNVLMPIQSPPLLLEAWVPDLAARTGGLFCGGSARMVEAALGIEGDDILYVGDHM